MVEYFGEQWGTGTEIRVEHVDLQSSFYFSV